MLKKTKAAIQHNGAEPAWDQTNGLASIYLNFTVDLAEPDTAQKKPLLLKRLLDIKGSLTDLSLSF